jgi:hypothetical protein
LDRIFGRLIRAQDEDSFGGRWIQKNRFDADRNGEKKVPGAGRSFPNPELTRWAPFSVVETTGTVLSAL